MKKPFGPGHSPAFRFVFTVGIVNLFADLTYEGGASINGPFMASLGASAAAISIVAGAGEFLGYALRSVFGWLSDKTGRYWTLAFAGYALNLLAVPAMALANQWEVAALFVLLERTGRAMRKPTVESMLSYTTGELGKGWVYALNSALDETGAALGPLFIALVLALGGTHRLGFATLLGTALLALAALTVARLFFPLPERLEQKPPAGGARDFTRAYWLYMIAGTFFAAGLTSFELISVHLGKQQLVAGGWAPVYLSVATVAGIVASLALGRLYDRAGIKIIVAGVVLSAMFAPLVFLGGRMVVLGGMVLWGIGYAVQDTLLKAVIAGVMPHQRRNFAFGLFYLGYGGGWLLGSIVTGLLYEPSRIGLVVFCIAVQLLSLPFFIAAEVGTRSR
jgi:MFS family permease